MRRTLAAAAAALLGAGVLLGQTAPTPKPSKPKSSARTPRVPLDFSGDWVLDPQASTGVTPQMANAILRVRQNGDRIWIEQIESRERQILSEQIVADGKKYEKALGHGLKGTVQADWGKDGKSLWLQVVAGPEGDPSSAYQRMVWRLQEGGKIWTRQTKTIEPGEVRETFLVFRKRETAKK